MRESLRTFDSHAKDGVRRAIALGIAMFGFQSLGTHNSFWVMLTVFVILAPNGRTTVQKAAVRVVGTLVGVSAVVALSAILPEQAALPLALLALALSLAASTRSTTVSAAFGAAAAATLTAVPSGDFLGFAAARLVDTLIGAALALAAGYLLWPRSKHLASQVPDDLTADASRAGVGPDRELTGIPVARARPRYGEAMPSDIEIAQAAHDGPHHRRRRPARHPGPARRAVRALQGQDLARLPRVPPGESRTPG